MRIPVNAERPYEVTVEHGAREALASSVEGCQRVAVVHPEPLADLAHDWAAPLGSSATFMSVPDGEHAKNVETVASLWARLADAGFTRSDAVIGLGGGATTDLAGFAAATYLRGVRYVSVPTTVLAMVDAAVGGKTGIDLPQGKNLVGAFWEPAAVIADLDALATLPVDQVRSGLGEVIKHGFIADERTLQLIEADPTAALDASSPTMAELIGRSIAIKARVVSGDLREATSSGSHVGRELLNYGHTFGHAVEKLENFRLSHGSCVAIGMNYVATLSHALGHLSASDLERHRRVLTSVGLPITTAPGRWDALRAAMSVDKKSRGSSLRFVCLDAVASPFIAVAPDEDVLRVVYDEVSA